MIASFLWEKIYEEDPGSNIDLNMLHNLQLQLSG